MLQAKKRHLRSSNKHNGYIPTEKFCIRIMFSLAWLVNENWEAGLLSTSGKKHTDF